MNYLTQINDKNEQIQDYITIIKCDYADVEIIGLLKEESFNINLSAQLSSSLVAAANESTIKGMAKAFGEKMFGNIFKSFSDTILHDYKSAYSTVKTYESSGDIQISFSIDYIPNTLSNKSYKQIIEEVSKLTQPEISKDRYAYMHSGIYDHLAVKDFIGNYKAFDGQLISVSIGNWFKASGLFCTSAIPTFSTAFDEDGEPMFLTINFTFEPYRILTAEDIASMFSLA